jgi:hypothetical protein
LDEEDMGSKRGLRESGYSEEGRIRRKRKCEGSKI